MKQILLVGLLLVSVTALAAQEVPSIESIEPGTEVRLKTRDSVFRELSPSWTRGQKEPFIQYPFAGGPRLVAFVVSVDADTLVVG